jgi:hypothetical protein
MNAQHQGQNQPASQNKQRNTLHQSQSQTIESHEQLKPGSRQPSLRSKNVDVKANRARVEVLEVVEASVVLGLELEGNGGASSTLVPGDVVSVARSQLDGAEALVNLGLGLVSGAGGDSSLKDAELDLAGAGEGESGSLELGLLGEEEVERAHFAGSRGGNVEVEDAADSAGSRAVEGGGVGLRGLGGVDGDDQVRELEVLAESAGALVGVLLGLAAVVAVAVLVLGSLGRLADLGRGGRLGL